MGGTDGIEDELTGLLELIDGLEGLEELELLYLLVLLETVDPAVLLELLKLLEYAVSASAFVGVPNVTRVGSFLKVVLMEL